MISDQSSPSFEEIRFRLAPTASVSPGDFVSVEARDHDGGLASWILSRVLDVHEVNPHEDPQSATVREVLPFDSDYAHEGESTVIFRIARSDPVEELPVLGGAGGTTDIRTLPRAGAYVVRPSEEQVSTAMGFPPDPDDGLYLGTLRNDDRIPVTLDRSAIQRHIGIVGGIGSGKSFVANLSANLAV